MVPSTAGPSWLGKDTLFSWDWDVTTELELVPLMQSPGFGDGLRDTQCLGVEARDVQEKPPQGAGSSLPLLQHVVVL